MAAMVASQIHVISTHKGDITDIAFSGSNSTLATVSGDKTIRLWSTRGEDFTELPHSPLLGHTYIIHCCTFCPLGTTLATCSTDGKLILWDAGSWEMKAQFQHPSKCGIRVCRFSPDSSRIATGSDDDSICVWDIATKTLVRSFTGLEDSVVSLAYSPDAHFLVSGSPNGDLYVWDAQFGHGRYLSLKVDAHDLGVTCCQFSPTFGTARNADSGVVKLLLATGGKDNLIKLWTFVAQVGSAEVLLKCHASLPGHTDIVMSCAFSPTGEILASGSFDKTVRLWDPLKGVALFSIDACHNRFVTCLAFSADGHLLATGSMDRTVKLWKLTDTSRIMHGLSGYEEPEAQEASPSVDVDHPMMAFTCQDVADWLTRLGLAQHTPAFTANAIDGPELLALTASDLQTHLGVAALGHRNKIIRSRDLGGLIPVESAPQPEVEMEQVTPVARPGDRVAWTFPRSSPASDNRPNPSHTAPTQQTESSSLSAPPQKRTVPRAQWSVDEVGEWLEGLGLGEHRDSFRAQAIDGRELLALSDSDLSTTLGITALGHRNKILRSRQTKTKSNQKTQVVPGTPKGDVRDHEEFVCPISMTIMRDPVIAADGYTYDRAAISSWLAQGKGSSPMTNAPLPHTSLTPNRTLKMMIQRHLEQQTAR